MNRTGYMAAGRFRRGFPLLFLLGLAFLLFANTFGAEWTYDDFPVIVENPDVRSWAGFLQDTYPGRPLRELTFLVDHAIFGLNPAGWHIQSILWHGLNAFLLFALARRLGLGTPIAWFAGLLFLAHPLQVEVVANVSHRKDTLAVAFSLMAFLAFMEAFRPGRLRWPWIFGALGLTGVAFLGKENAVMLPAVMAAYELAFVERERRVLLRRPILPALAAVAAGAGAIAWVAFGGGQTTYLFKMHSLLQFNANYFDSATMETFYRMVLKSWTFLFTKVLWPADLAVEYTYAIPSSWLDPWVLAALVGLLLYGAGLWFFVRHSPVAFLALAWAGAFWLPVSNLWPLAYFAADRYLYAPMAGISLLLALGAAKVLKRPAPLLATAAAVLVLLGGLTLRQNRVWLTSESLWTQAYRVNPESSFALNNMGAVHFMRGELLRAIDYYARAGKVNPLNPNAFYNIGMIYERRGDLRSAVANYEWFMRLDHPMFRGQAEELRRRLGREYGIHISPDIAGQGPFKKDL